METVAPPVTTSSAVVPGLRATTCRTEDWVRQQEAAILLAEGEYEAALRRGPACHRRRRRRWLGDRPRVAPRRVHYCRRSRRRGRRLEDAEHALEQVAEFPAAGSLRFSGRSSREAWRSSPAPGARTRPSKTTSSPRSASSVSSATRTEPRSRPARPGGVARQPGEGRDQQARNEAAATLPADRSAISDRARARTGTQPVGPKRSTRI